MGGLAVGGVLFVADVGAIALFCGEEGRTTAAEGIEDDVARLGGEFDQGLHQFERFLGGVVSGFSGGEATAEDVFGTGFVGQEGGFVEAADAVLEDVVGDRGADRVGLGEPEDGFEAGFEVADPPARPGGRIGLVAASLVDRTEALGAMGGFGANPGQHVFVAEAAVFQGGNAAVTEATSGKDDRAAARFQYPQPVRCPLLTPGVVLLGDLAIGFGPAIDRFAPGFEDGSGFGLGRTVAEEGAVGVVMQHVPGIEANAVGNIAQNQMYRGIGQLLDRPDAVGGGDRIEEWGDGLLQENLRPGPKSRLPWQKCPWFLNQLSIALEQIDRAESVRAAYFIHEFSTTEFAGVGDGGDSRDRHSVSSECRAEDCAIESQQTHREACSQACGETGGQTRRTDDGTRRYLEAGS